MGTFNHWEVIEEDNNVVVILKLDSFLSETSEEFLQKSDGQPENFKENIKKFIRSKLPTVHQATVKVMVGTTIIATFANLPINNKAYAHETDFNMSYLYFGGTSGYLKQVEQTKGNLSTAAPSYFDINADGSLKLTNQLDQYFINEMHRQGIEVVPFLSNHWDRDAGRAALQNREKLATDIAAAVERYNLDGVNVDIENVSEIDRENYTDLVRLLREKIPREKEVSVAVAANPNGWTKGWHGSYDYNKLAQYSDYLMIMAYDESWSGGPEGPVASYPWVKRSIEYAIKQGVPSEKVVLGLPFYGRYWQEGKSTGGYGISKIRIEEMINQYESTVIYDEVAKSPKAFIKIKEGEEPFKFSGTVLGPGTYHIWFENDASIQAKVSLVHDYNLKGTGSWSLGQENPSMWNNFGVWLKGHGSLPNPQTEQTNPPQPSATTSSYTVVSGDTLLAIAKRYITTVSSIKALNNLTSDTIYVGQKLIVPTLENPPAAAIKNGWVIEGTQWYFYNQSGQLHKGWLLDNGTWYYLNPNDGKMLTGWTYVDNKWYFINKSGAMKTGWVKENGEWYFLENSGAMKVGWKYVNGKWYFMNKSGAMQTGWLWNDGKWYFLEQKNGDMVTGWRLINSKWYYFFSSGEMAVNTFVGGYKLGSDGAWIK